MNHRVVSPNNISQYLIKIKLLNDILKIMFPIKSYLNVQPLTLIMHLGKLFSKLMIFYYLFFTKWKI